MKNNLALQQMLDKINMNAAVSRMIFTLSFALLSVHLIACFWYLAAKFQDLDPDTWVSRMGKQDLEPYLLYLESLYWAL